MTLKPGGGPAKPAHITADRVGRMLPQPRRIHCGHCSGMTSEAATVRLGCLARTVCPDCISVYEEAS